MSSTPATIWKRAAKTWDQNITNTMNIMNTPNITIKNITIIIMKKKVRKSVSKSKKAQLVQEDLQEKKDTEELKDQKDSKAQLVLKD